MFKMIHQPVFSRDNYLPQACAKMVDNFMNDAFLGGVQTSHAYRPVSDIIAHEDHFQIHVSLPGFAKENIQLALKDNTLTINAERTIQSTEDTKYHLQESFFGKVSRSFKLPANVDKENILAEFKDGILNVRLNKTASKEENISSIEIK